jgi:catechol-2,3-dioxygenase
MAKQREYPERDEIYVRNARAAKEWYSELLGLRTAHYEPGWTMFVLTDEAYSRDIVLVQVNEAASPEQQERVGHYRLIRELAGSDAFWAFYEHVKAKGIVIDRIADRGDACALCLSDPDGNGVEIYYRYKKRPESDSTTDAAPCRKASANEGLPGRLANGTGCVCYLALHPRAAA